MKPSCASFDAAARKYEWLTGADLFRIFVDAPHHIQLPPEWKTPDTPSEADSDRDLKPRGWSVLLLPPW